MSLQLSPPQHTSSTAHLFGELSSTCLVSAVSIKNNVRASLPLSPHIPSLRLYVVTCCVVICKHPSSPLSPRQQDRQRVIKNAPAALCLMSLSAHYSLGAASQQLAASVWPDSSFTTTSHAANCSTEVTLMHFIQEIMQLTWQRKLTVGKLLFFSQQSDFHDIFVYSGLQVQSVETLGPSRKKNEMSKKFLVEYWQWGLSLTFLMVYTVRYV